MFPYPYVARTDQIHIFKTCLIAKPIPFFDFEPKPAIGFESKTKNRGHEPDPNMDPRVEDKKIVRAACWIVLKTNVCVKHVQKLLNACEEFHSAKLLAFL